MAYMILIRKVSSKDDKHYYSVFKDNSLNEINYYIGIDSTQKKIFFYEDMEYNTKFGSLDVQTGKFEEIDIEKKARINSRVVFKCYEAIKNNNFPQSISWES